MNQTNCELLNKSIEDLKAEKNHIELLIENNSYEIKKLEINIQSLNYDESIDLKAFSPRMHDKRNDELLPIYVSNKTKLENQNNDYKKTLKRIKENINTINTILENEDAFENNRKNKNIAVLNIQEEERQRIARDLHDTSLQNLAHLVHKIELCGMYIDQDPIKAKLELAVINKNLKSTIEEIRNTIFDLRPMIFDDFGLKETIEILLDKMKDQYGYEIESRIEEPEYVDNIILVSIYRV
ncbi:histidine kinase, partial [Lachnospiraceae bacterium OttesenSCG-928-D06]|nr:histidine kinase [Lachnospiraceae bacterium OttesenSCG-928-D06]